MSTISRDSVLKLAQLSSLQLQDSEVDGLIKDINAILQYVEQLNELDTTGVEPAYQVTGLVNVFRDDKVDESIGRDTLLNLAPSHQNNQIKVPKVL